MKDLQEKINFIELMTSKGLKFSEAKVIADRVEKNGHEFPFEEYRWELRAAILGLHSQGATYLRHDDQFMYCDIPKLSPLHADEFKLSNAAFIVRTLTGLGLKVRREK